MSETLVMSDHLPQSRSALRSRKLAFLVFALLPFHVVVMYFIGAQMGFDVNDVSFIALKMWKEVVVVLAIIAALLTTPRNDKRPFDSLDWWVMVFVFMGILYTVLGDRIALAVWSFRSLFGLFLFYVFGRIQRFSLDDFKRFFSMIVFIGVITSLFSIYQVEVLGTEFHTLILGLDEAPGQLQAQEYDKIRATSTFISVHEYGLFLVFALFAFPFLLDQRSRKKGDVSLGLIFAGLIMLVGLGYSFSRSSIVILILGMLFVGFRRLRDFVVIAIFGILMFLLLEAMGTLSNVQAVAEGVDPSSFGHLQIAGEATDLTFKNPMGIGLGSVGVVARRFDPSAPQFEGEWFNILVQMGVIGGGIALLLWWKVFRRALKTARDKLYSSGERHLSTYVALIVIGTVVRELILPRDQMNSSLAWFTIGAYISYLQHRVKANS